MVFGSKTTKSAKKPFSSAALSHSETLGGFGGNCVHGFG